MHRVRRAASLALLLALLAPAGAGAQAPPAPPDAELVRGVRQVQEGDFETAVLTLDAVVRRLQGIPARSRDLVEAYVHLGVAEVALDRRDSARGHFKSALALNRRLRLGSDRFSPKVLAVFEEARGEAGAARGGGSSALPFLLAGVAGAAVAVGVLAAPRGESGGTGRVSFGNARFASATIVCPDNSTDVNLPFSILIDGVNGTSEPVTLSSVSVAMTIVSSPAFPSEVGFISNRSARVLPPAMLPARGTTVISVESSFLCGNGPGDPGRFNEWTGRVTLATLDGFQTVDTADRIRVNLP
jgi:hypothetical protein